jgi:hypothetical protein
MVRSCDVVITLLLEDALDLCIGAAYVLGAVMLNGGVGSGVRNCCEFGVSLCMFANCHAYWCEQAGNWCCWGERSQD